MEGIFILPASVKCELPGNPLDIRRDKKSQVDQKQKQTESPGPQTMGKPLSTDM